MVNGQHFSGTSFQLDGTDNRDPVLGIIVINPTLESVTQAKVTTQNYDAEFGQALAGVVTVQTKSGTNDFHGSAFEFRRTGWGQARNPFTQPPDRPLPATKWNQFGGSLGGSLIKNRLFLFGDYQGTRRTTGASVRLAPISQTIDLWASRSTEKLRALALTTIAISCCSSRMHRRAGAHPRLVGNGAVDSSAAVILGYSSERRSSFH